MGPAVKVHVWLQAGNTKLLSVRIPDVEDCFDIDWGVYLVMQPV